MIYAGTVIEINNNKTYVFTMDYSVVTLRTKKDYVLGQQISFTKRDKYTDLYLVNSKTFRTFVMAAALLIFIISAAFAGAKGLISTGGFDEVCTALVSVDINPSIEISINKDGEIVDVQARNEDGKELIRTLNLKSKKLLDGVNEIVAAAEAMGYINASKNIVLVSAALYDTAASNGMDNYAGQLKQILTSLESSDKNANVLTVFIDNPEIIEEAKSDDLSIGKELLYQYAISQDGSLTAEDIRKGSISELLDKLNALEQDGKLSEGIKNQMTASDLINVTPTALPSNTAASATPSLTVTPEPTATPALTATPEPTATPKPTVTPEPTATPKPSPTPKPESKDFNPNLSVSTSGDTIKFSWTPVNSSKMTYDGEEYKGFCFYKVVASATNDHPIYPDDGYLAYISDKDTSKWSVTPSEGNYNLSPELISGESYYLSITYVFENGKFTSDVEKLTVPTYQYDEAENTVSSLELSVWADGDTLKFSWTPVGSSSISYKDKTYRDFCYYKVVASETNKNPKYPDDGYLTYITDYDADYWSVNPSKGDYNYSPELVSGTTYYFSITYVFSNGKLYSNSVKYTVP